jgi:hypothetical protein
MISVLSPIAQGGNEKCLVRTDVPELSLSGLLQQPLRLIEPLRCRNSRFQRSVAISGLYLKETFRSEIRGRAKRQATWLAFALPTILSLSPAGIPGMVTIDHFARGVWLRGKNHGGTQSRATRRNRDRGVDNSANLR